MKNKLIFDIAIYQKYKEYDSKSRPYMYWYNMLNRCYNILYIVKNRTYLDCNVCDEWLYFPNFCKWFDENYYEIENYRMELDKDILIKGNKEYSPYTCTFVPQFINALFVRQISSRIDSTGKWIKDTPIGVHIDRKSNKYYGSLKVCGKTIRSELFNTPTCAFDWYQDKKETYMREIADIYKEQIPPRLYWVMKHYEVELED